MIFFQYLLIILAATPVFVLAAYVFIKTLQTISKQNRREKRIDELKREARYSGLRDSNDDSDEWINRKGGRR